MVRCQHGMPRSSTAFCFRALPSALIYLVAEIGRETSQLQGAVWSGPCSTGAPRHLPRYGADMNAQLNSDVITLNARVQQFIGQPRKGLIDGRWVAAKSGETFDVFNPASGQRIAV